MNKGVEILLERMESNPDEFTNEYSANTTIADRKWGDIAEKIHMRMTAITQDPETKPYYKHQLDFLTDEEIIALHNKLKDVRAEAFTREIMGRLLGSKTETNTQKMQASIGTTGSQHHQAILAQQQAYREYELANHYNQMGAQHRANQINVQKYANGVEGTGQSAISTAVDGTWNRVFGKGK
jgi:murein tripeptide amidase MpaA